MACGDYKAASRDVETFLSKDSKNLEILQLKEKISSFASNDSCDELEVDKLRKEAQDCLSNGLSDQAVKKLKEAIRIYEKSMGSSTDKDVYFSLLLLLGKANCNLGRLDDATAAYDSIIKLSPKHFKAYLRRSEIKLQQVILYMNV